MHNPAAGKKFIAPGGHNSVYMAIPDCERNEAGELKAPESLTYDVDALRNAMAGCGTDEQVLIRILCSRTPHQIKAIDELYFKKFGRELAADIESELGGDVKAGCLMLIKGQAVLDAQVLWDAFDGIGTDEERVNEILATRHPGQVEDMKAAFLTLDENKDQKTLFDVVCGDTSFKYEKFLKCMLDRAGFIASLCYEAMHGNKYDFTNVSAIGTRDKVLVRLLLSINKDNDGIKNLLTEYHDPWDQGWREDLERMAHLPDIEDVVAAYPELEARGFGVNSDCKTLAESIESEASFDYKATLLWLIKDKDECGAEAIHEALGDTFVSKDTIMAVIASRSAFGRAGVADAYKRLYGKALRDELTERMGDGGEFNQVARDMFQDSDERTADYLYLAMHGAKTDKAELIDESKKDNMLENAYRTGMIAGLGTDEQRLSRTVLYSSKGELKGAMQAYNAKFADDPSENLIKAIFKETGGDYRAMLMYKFRRAQTGLLHAPRKKLVRCDDMPSMFPFDI